MKENDPSKIIAFRPRVRKPPQPKQGGGAVEYEEIIQVPRWVRIALYSFFALIIAYFLIAPYVTHRSSDPAYLLVALVFGLVAWMIHLFLTLKVHMTSEGITFGFYLFSKKIPYDRIVDCSVMRYNVMDFMGYGIRKGMNGITMYNIPGDQQIAVRVLVREEEDQRKEYAFSSKRPQVVCKKIQMHLYRGPTSREDKKEPRKEGTLSSNH